MAVTIFDSLSLIVNCKWKKSTVTISACKVLKALIVTVDFFHLQSTFLQVLTATVDFFLVFVVHLPHFVQCITIPISYWWATEIKKGRGGATENRKSVFNDPGVNENSFSVFIHHKGD